MSKQYKNLQMIYSKRKETRDLVLAYQNYMANGQYKTNRYWKDVAYLKRSSPIEFLQKIEQSLLVQNPDQPMRKVKNNVAHIVHWFNNFEIESSTKEFTGEIFLNLEDSIKIMSLTKKEILTFYKKPNKYFQVKNRIQYFIDIYTTPYLEFNDQKKYIREKLIDFQLYKKIKHEDKEKLFFYIIEGTKKYKLGNGGEKKVSQIIHEARDHMYKDTSTIEELIHLIPLSFWKDICPQTYSHGDLTHANVLYDGTDFYVVDYESARTTTFYYDLFTFIFTAREYGDNRYLLTEYLNGSFNAQLKDLFDFYKMPFNKDHLGIYLVLYLIERSVMLPLVDKEDLQEAKRIISNWISILRDYYEL